MSRTSEDFEQLLQNEIEPRNSSSHLNNIKIERQLNEMT